MVCSASCGFPKHNCRKKKDFPENHFLIFLRADGAGGWIESGADGTFSQIEPVVTRLETAFILLNEEMLEAFSLK